MKINESAETYLETILMLGKEKGAVRSIDIANELDYTKPSVSVAMKNLRAGGHITVDDSGFITLTDSGRKIAETMYERHTLISDWLIFLGVDKKAAVNDACKMEHSMSAESFSAIKKHIEAWKQNVYSKKQGAE
ncbi:MAG: metal-dependent transcriptional regulator [Oscillospiraceae bacterium]|nr:metal-dependent transcriptional regulator [Oscillospiraceae bacterium]